MRSISIRQFQRNFYKEIATLPIVVTKNNKPVFVVTLPTPNVVTSDSQQAKPKIVVTNVTTTKPLEKNNVTTSVLKLERGELDVSNYF